MKGTTLYSCFSSESTVSDHFAPRIGVVLAALLIIHSEPKSLAAAPIEETGRADVEGLSDADDGAIVPDAPEGLAEINAARAALAEGDIESCRNKLRAAYAKSPNLPPPKLMLARLMLGAGQIRLGRQLLEEVAQSHPNHPDLYLLFGKLALADGHATDAALHFEKALSLAIPTNWNDGQRAFLKRACLEGQTSVAERRGDWDEAADLYQQQIEARPKDANLRDRFAMVLFQAGEDDRAFEQFDLSFLQDASMNPPEISMAVMEVRTGDYRKADQWFAKAVEKHSDNPAVHFEHSIAMLFQDRTQAAAASAARVAELGMNSPLLTMHRGLIAMQQADSAAAEKYFTQLLDSSPKNFGAMAKLALVMVEQDDSGKQNKAVELAEAAAKLNDNSTEVAAVLGWIYYRTGQKKKGRTLLQAAAAHPANDPLPLFLYARVLYMEEATSDAEQAAKLLRQRLEQPGMFPLRPAAKKWLASVVGDAE